MSLFIKEATFSDIYIYNFSVKLPWMQGRDNKLNTTLFDRYHSQN